MYIGRDNGRCIKEIPSLSYKKLIMMNIQLLKYEIIEWIMKTNDNTLLQSLKTIKDSNLGAQDWYEGLPREHKESIIRGIKDHEQGNVLRSNEFWAGNEEKI